VVDEPCPTCHGVGVTMQSRNVKVRVPAGIKNGGTLRIPGKGAPGRSGGPAGDLLVTVNVRAHPVFGRKGDHITLTVPVTYPEAALGSTISVPTLDGDTVTLKVPAGTPSGRTFRVKGRGVDRRGRKGDLLVSVEVAVPQRVDGQAKKLLDEYASAIANEDPRADLIAQAGKD
jgi:molecular chaperone DnaJ